MCARFLSLKLSFDFVALRIKCPCARGTTRLKYDQHVKEKIGDSKRRKRSLGKNKYWRYNKKKRSLHRRMSSEYSTEEEQKRLRNALAALENKPLPLWRLFREALLSGGACRDIVEKHVMCKLNGTDLKFFYEVNTETRKLVKRSSRESDLKKNFNVDEISSTYL